MKDVMLISLITLAEADPPMEHDITLLVGGFLVSGFVISYEKYVHHHQTTAGIESAIKQFNADNPEPTEKTYNFIHLRDAKYYVPGANPIPGNMGVFVRISLESIHGFSFGKLELA
jgi:hypothetical protein